jgi:DNA-binding response OmpR family regulator
VNVLLVEDNEDTALALGVLFQLEGIGFRSARSGAEALRAFATGAAPDVLMLDLFLPDMPGAALVAELGRVTSVPPVVLHSAASATEIADAAAAIGAVATLRKPCNARELIATTRRVAQCANVPQV